MDLIQTVGIILAIWAVLRSIGNERECGLREMEIRMQEQADDNPELTGIVQSVEVVEKAAASPPAKPKAK